jgi:hypothetical protein
LAKENKEDAVCNECTQKDMQIKQLEKLANFYSTKANQLEQQLVLSQDEQKIN